MLSPYNHAILVEELRHSDYDGKSADDAWTWLNTPVPPVSSRRESWPLLTALEMVTRIGVKKAEAVAAHFMASFPTIGAAILAAGLEPRRDDIKDIISGFAGTVLADSDVLALLSPVVTHDAPPVAPFAERFSPDRWPNVNSDGKRDDQTPHCQRCHKPAPLVPEPAQAQNHASIVCSHCGEPRYRLSKLGHERWSGGRPGWHPGEYGVGPAPAISGFPNTLERPDFDRAWKEAGR
jgi:hypothetical protein